MVVLNNRALRNMQEQIGRNQELIERNQELIEEIGVTTKVYFIQFEGTPEIGAEVEIPIREIIDSVSPDKFGGHFPVIYTPYFLSPTGVAEDVTDYYQMNLYRVDFENEIVYFSRKRVNGDGEFIIKLTLVDDNHAIYDEVNQVITKDTFMATYGVTTYNEVTNAVLQKKLIYCVYPNQGAFEYIYVGVVDSKRTFVAANPKGGYKVLTLDSANNWVSKTMKVAADDVIISTTQTTVQSNIIRIDETLDLKQDILTAGTGIDITNNVISATGGGSGIQIKTYAQAQSDLNDFGKAINYFNAGGFITYNYMSTGDKFCYPLRNGGSSGVTWMSIDNQITITCSVMGQWSVTTS